MLKATQLAGDGVTWTLAFSSYSLSVFSTYGLAQPYGGAAQDFTCPPLRFRHQFYENFLWFPVQAPRATFTGISTLLHYPGCWPCGIQRNILIEMKSPRKAMSDLRDTVQGEILLK